MQPVDRIQVLLRLIDAGAFSQAYKILKQLHSIHINDKNTIYQIAKCLLALNKSQDLKQLIKILKKIAPNDPNIYVIPAIEAMNHQAYRLAVGYLRQAKKLAPQDPSIDVVYGM